MQLIEKFMSFVETIPFHECWEWSGHVDKNGYGKIRIGPEKLRASRVSYELFNGPIPSGLIICHSCDNTGCVNPKHLWAGTWKDNMVDKGKKGRNYFANKTHCIRGHEFNKENTSLHKNKKKNTVSRDCKICAKIRRCRGSNS